MRKTFTKFLTVLMLSLLTTGVIAQEIYYVNVANPTPGNGKTTWANAFTGLQAALDIAVSGDQIWVAKGTYKPSKTLGGIVESPISRDATFVLSEGVKIYGGFDGTETLLSARDAAKIHTDNKTTLSGDFDNDDVTTDVVDGVINSITGNIENAHHVVVSYNNTAATVLDGFTISGGSADGSDSVTPETDYTFERNLGGGIFTRRSSPTLNNLVVKNNYSAATVAAGAGVYLGGGKQNESPQSADEMNITNTEILYNLTHGYGGGVYIAGYTGYVFSIKLKDVNVEGNKAAVRGGGIYFSGTSVQATLENAVFSKNLSSSFGGAIYLTGTRLAIVGGGFLENKSVADGGAIYALSVTTANRLTITGTNFEKNTGTRGAAIHGNNGGKFEIKNATFKQNTGTNGGAIHANITTNFDIENSTFVGNVGTSGGAIGTISNAANSAATFNIVGGSFTGNTGSTGGAIHMQNKAVFNIANVIFENNTAPNGGAIYTSSTNAIGYNTVTITGGSFTGNKSTSTTTTTNIGGGAIHATNASDIVVQGVTFTGNTAARGGGAILTSGLTPAAGEEATTLRNKLSIKGESVFDANIASGGTATGGGAIFADQYSDVEIENTSFKANAVNGTGYGGAIRIEDKNQLMLKNAIVHGNEASASGGIYLAGSTYEHQIINTILSSNRSTGNGGALSLSVAKVSVINTAFYGNDSKGTNGGGAVRLTGTGSTAKIYNSIIYGNTSTAVGKEEVSVGTSANPVATTVVDIKNTITQAYTAGTNVYVGAVPQFISTDYNNGNNADFLKLTPVTGNPAIDAGDNNVVPKIFNNDDPPVDITLTAATDLAGVLRFNGTVDLGAYENHTPLPIKLADFSAKANASSVVVNWVTETETNNSHFILEKSTDGVNFVTIANVPSKGNGAKYSYTDFSPANGANYYRLTQVDHDGTKVTYNPIVVNFGLKASTVNVYPNPANGATVNVDFGAERYNTLDVLSVSGQVLQSHHVTGASSAKIDVSTLAKGVYLIKLSKSGASTVQKLIKN